MSKAIEPNINEEINSAGDGSGVALPPAFVFVNTKKHRTYKSNNTNTAFLRKNSILRKY